MFFDGIYRFIVIASASAAGMVHGCTVYGPKDGIQVLLLGFAFGSCFWVLLLGFAFAFFCLLNPHF